MRGVRWMALVVAVVAVGCDPTSDGPDDTPLVGEEIQAHLQRLASDEFMGRGPGQPGGDMAAEYIAEQFQAEGLSPVFGGYFQPVSMLASTTDPETASLAFSGPNGDVAGSYMDQFVLNPGDPRADSVMGSAEVVFVGYGIDAPEAGWNDFAGVDVAGKVLMILVNDPPAPEDDPDRFGGDAMTYYGRWTYKYEEAARQGALAALIVHETEPAGYPWSVVRGGWSSEQFALPPDSQGPSPAGMTGWIDEGLARRVLSLGGMDFDDLKERAAERGFQAVPTGVTATASLDATTRQVETRNVVGMVEGTDRPGEVILVTSHYDHFGVGEPVDGDSIYNGAYDNASGTALLIELAGAMARIPGGLERSVVFIATAAEEQGLLGAEWYVQSPLYPLNQTVAEVNLDGANLWGETDDVTVHGAERSELGGFIRGHAEELGMEIVPDQEPEKGFFFRSDHFPFARAGVPSLYIEHGRRFRGQPEGWGDRLLEHYTAEQYHSPKDELSDDFQYDGAVQQGTLIYRTVRDIARSDAWPEWFDGQEFKAARDAMSAGPAGSP